MGVAAELVAALDDDGGAPVPTLDDVLAPAVSTKPDLLKAGMLSESELRAGWSAASSGRSVSSTSGVPPGMRVDADGEEKKN